MELPLWLVEEQNVRSEADVSRAVAGGLRFRAVEDTVRDTLAWAPGGGRDCRAARERDGDRQGRARPRARAGAARGVGSRVITYLAVAAATWGVAMALSPLLQVRAILARRSSASVSIAYQQVLLVGFVLWLAYGIALENLALIIPNTIAAIVSATAIAVTARFRHAAPR